MMEWKCPNKTVLHDFAKNLENDKEYRQGCTFGFFSVHQLKKASLLIYRYLVKREAGLPAQGLFHISLF